MNIFIVIFCIGLAALFICLKNRRRSLEKNLEKVKASKDSRKSLKDFAYNAEHLLKIFSKIKNDSKNNILEKAEKIKFNLVNWKIILAKLDDYNSIFSKKQQI